MHGLYAVTPDTNDTEALLARVKSVLEGGARFVQYRNKTATPELRREQAAALQALCAKRVASLIVNDHVALALEVDAAGVHLGGEDAALADARAVLGADKIIGISCYNRFELARAARDAGADYVAFGSFFPSRVKPGAVRASTDLLARARAELGVPVVAIGGITIQNAPPLVDAGASALAVISALFDAPDVAAAARAFTALYDDRTRS